MAAWRKQAIKLIDNFLLNVDATSSLEVGCDDAGISRKLAEKYPKIFFEGVDYRKDKIDDAYQIDGIPEVNGSKHTIDIKEQNLVQLNIDLEQRGIAGDDSWYSKPQEKYLIKGQEKHRYSFYLIPFENTSKEMFIELSKQY